MGAAEAETESSDTSVCLDLFETNFLACSKSSERDRQRLLGSPFQIWVAFTDFHHDLGHAIWN